MLFFYKIKLHVIPQVASCFFLRGWKQELFCSVEFPRFLRKFIFLSLLSVWQSLWFVKAILFLLSSAHEWILLTLFSPTIWHWQLQFATMKAKQGELIESGRDKWAAFICQSLTQTEVQKHSKTCCFLTPETNPSASWCLQLQAWIPLWLWLLDCLDVCAAFPPHSFACRQL